MVYLEQQAYEFAVKAHEGQTRKYTGDPYVTHCRNVAILCRYAKLPPYAVAAAYLHDTLEDTSTTYEDLVRAFGIPTAQLVLTLTDQTPLSYGNRAARKLAEMEKLYNSCTLAQSIKIADLIDNSRSICEHDPRFAAVYMLEMENLVVNLTHAGHWLITTAKDIISDYNKDRLEK